MVRFRAVQAGHSGEHKVEHNQHFMLFAFCFNNLCFVSQAGHSGEHEVEIAFSRGKLGSIDANRNEMLLGWDTDMCVLLLLLC